MLLLGLASLVMLELIVAFRQKHMLNQKAMRRVPNMQMQKIKAQPRIHAEIHARF